MLIETVNQEFDLKKTKLSSLPLLLFWELSDLKLYLIYSLYHDYMLPNMIHNNQTKYM